METGLNGKVVLVTGGAGGIGQAICKAFAQEGCIVVVHHNSSTNEAASLAEKIGGLAIPGDLRDSSVALKLIRKIVSKYGARDICIANAGFYPTESRKFWEIDSDRWASTIESNLGLTISTISAYLGHATKVGSGSILSLIHI